MKPDEFVTLLGRCRASAILRTGIAEAAAPAMEAAIRAGFRIVEFTLNTPGALDRIEEFAHKEEIVVGAGTVLSPADADAAVERGARFLVSPVVDPQVIRRASELGVAMMPGTHSPTEMLTAHRLGAPLQKLFPAPTAGPGYVRACLGPMPFLRIVPTSGVDSENAAAFFEAGAFAIGFVQPLFDPIALADGRFEEIEERGRRLLAAVERDGG